jgi:hypothetical protein
MQERKEMMFPEAQRAFSRQDRNMATINQNFNTSNRRKLL